MSDRAVVHLIDRTRTMCGLPLRVEMTLLRPFQARPLGIHVCNRCELGMRGLPLPPHA